MYLLCLASLSSCGRSTLEKAITNNIYRINSLESQDASDLIPFARAIGHSKVVLLGEQDHGDATTFEAKTRLVKYLHEHLGFDIIVFESDFFALHNQWSQVKTADEVGELIDDNLFSIWTRCQQFAPLKQYLKECFGNGRTLQIAGMDNQLHGLYSQKHFPNWFENFLNANDINTFKAQDNNPTKLLPFLDSLMYHSRRQTSIADTLLLKKFYSHLKDIRQQLKNKGWSDEYEMQVLSSLETQVFVMLTRKRGTITEGAQARDKQMAANLYWLIAHQFKNKKVIVWAASSHIFTSVLQSVPNLNPVPYSPMGSHFVTQDTSMPVYALGFSSYQGSSRRFGRQAYSFTSKEHNSLEAWLYKRGAEYAFIDFDQAKASMGLSGSFFMSGAGHVQTKQTWMDGFNGVFYIRNMKPCTFAE